MSRTPRLLPLALAFAAFTAACPAATLDLLGAYDLARRNDPQLSAAENRALAVAEGIAQSRAALLPNIAGTASTDRTKGDGTSPQFDPQTGQLISQNFDVDTESTSYGIQLRQSVFDWGNYTRLRGARALSAQGEAQYQQAEDALYVRVAEAYFNVLTAEDTLAFANAEATALGRQFDQAQQRFEVGLAAITDVNEAQSQRDAATAAVVLAENALEDAEEALTEIIGAPVETIKALREELPLRPPQPAELEAWVENARKQNPQIVAQQFAVSAAEASIATARAGHLPTLDLTANYLDNTSSGNRGGFFSTNSESTSANGTVGLQLTVPIFSGGLVSANARRAVHDRDTARDVLEQTERGVVRQTRFSYRAIAGGVSEIEARRQAVKSATSALEAVQAGYEVGTRTIVDLLIAQRQLFQAQRDYSQARHNYIVNGLRLKQNAGDIQRADVAEVNALLTDERKPVLIPDPTRRDADDASAVDSEVPDTSVDDRPGDDESADADATEPSSGEPPRDPRE